MFRKVFVLLLVYFLAFYPVLTPLANASTKEVDGRESWVEGQKTEDLNSKIPNPQSEIVKSFGRLPLYFIQNNGQIDEKVKYYEKGSGHATYFTSDGVYLTLIKSQELSVKNEIASGLKPIAMTPDSRLV